MTCMKILLLWGGVVAFAFLIGSNEARPASGEGGKHVHHHRIPGSTHTHRHKVPKKHHHGKHEHAPSSSEEPPKGPGGNLPNSPGSELNKSPEIPSADLSKIGKLIANLPPDLISNLIGKVTPDQFQEIIGKIPTDQAVSVLKSLPSGQLKKLAGTLNLGSISSGELPNLIAHLPTGLLAKFLETFPSTIQVKLFLSLPYPEIGQIFNFAPPSAQQTIFNAIPTDQLGSIIKDLPGGKIPNLPGGKLPDVSGGSPGPLPGGVNPTDANAPSSRPSPAGPPGGVDDTQPNDCRDTPGYDVGAVKQFFRGTRDAGDALLDGANGLIQQVLGTGVKGLLNGVENGGKELLCHAESVFSDLSSDFDIATENAKHGLIDIFEGLGHPSKNKGPPPVQAFVQGVAGILDQVAKFADSGASDIVTGVQSAVQSLGDQESQ